jgi:hypothetical protein
VVFIFKNSRVNDTHSQGYYCQTKHRRTTNEGRTDIEKKETQHRHHRERRIFDVKTPRRGEVKTSTMEGQQGWKDINISKESKKDITDGRTSMVEVHKYPEGK